MRPMPFQLSFEVLIQDRQFCNSRISLIPSKEVISFQHCAIITGTGADDHDINIAFAQTGKKFQPLIGVEKGWWLHLQCLVDDKNAPVIMMNYTWLMTGSETILLKTLCVKEPDILHTMFLFSMGFVSLMMMRTCHVFAARRRSKKKVDCCTCGLLPGEWQTIRRDPSFPNWVVTNKL